MLDEPTIGAPQASDLQTLDIPFSQVPEGLAAMAIMGGNGDTKHIWDPTKPAEVEAARTLFNQLTRKNYLAFKATGKEGDKGDQVREFDPSFGRLIFTPQMVGG